MSRCLEHGAPCLRADRGAGSSAGASALAGHPSLRRILAVDFGTSYRLTALAVLALLGGSRMALRRRKHLTFGILSGMPELSERRYPGRLLTDGPYARIRHPRYVEVVLWTVAYALFANYLGSYLVVIGSLPVIYLIVVLEERELRERFGAEYIEYCRRVPRFVPRRRARID